MSSNRIYFAHGSPALPTIVSSFERAKQHAFAEAIRSGEPRPVLAIDLQHPDMPVKVLGHVHPDGTYVDA